MGLGSEDAPHASRKCSGSSARRRGAPGAAPSPTRHGDGTMPSVKLVPITNAHRLPTALSLRTPMKSAFPSSHARVCATFSCLFAPQTQSVCEACFRSPYVTSLRLVDGLFINRVREGPRNAQATHPACDVRGEDGVSPGRARVSVLLRGGDGGSGRAAVCVVVTSQTSHCDITNLAL